MRQLSHLCQILTVYETTRNFLEIIENKKSAFIFNHFGKDPDICRYLVYTELPPPEMADWDADDFEPDTASASVAARPSDKWDGEDEDDDIKVRLVIDKSFENKTILLHKDAWDAESEEENSEKSEEAKPVKVKKKKNLAQKIAEKEEAAQLAKLEKLKREEEEREANTPEGESAQA